MNPTPGQVSAIKGFVAALAGGWANADAQIRASMQSTPVANPVARATVPATFTATSVFGSVSAASVAKLVTLPSFNSDVIPLLNIAAKTSANITDLNTWAACYFKAGALTQAEFDSLAAPTAGTTTGAATGLFNQTQPDPSWPAQVPWDVANLGRPADDFDLETARHS